MRYRYLVILPVPELSITGLYRNPHHWLQGRITYLTTLSQETLISRPLATHLEKWLRYLLGTVRDSRHRVMNKQERYTIPFSIHVHHLFYEYRYSTIYIIVYGYYTILNCCYDTGYLPTRTIFLYF